MATKLHFEPCPCDEITTPWISVRKYLLGLYTHDDATIHVWMYKPGKEELQDLKRLKQTWKHEYLHFMDDMNGIPGPEGSHNKEFDARITLMGWDDI